MKILLLLLLLSSCFSSKKMDVKPMKVTPEHQCAVDGMILSNFSGPKAQVHFKDRPNETAVDFYCETEEMFKVYLEPGMKARINELFVQDAGVIDWEKPVGGWINAIDAIYVVESKRMGAMGTTFVPFSEQKAANKFINDYGGKILSFGELISHIQKKSN